MASHTAKSLFDLNIQSAKDSIALYDAIAKLKPQEMNIDWVLRAAVVFAVSALDTYFHDKVKYKVGKYDLGNLPPALARFEIQIRALSSWDQARRKGNVLRNWVTDDLATRPLQSPTAIAEALKLGGIENLWDTIEPDKNKKNVLLKELNLLIQRRNQISHEGDRMTSRRSGKILRRIDRAQVESWMTFVESLVQRVEKAFSG
ncbi:MAG TPA: HEPN domain-containing protein [Anaerolineae bacterium]|nr:HEPN domain-containing protein [Anaerolineae bacterium]